MKLKFPMLFVLALVLGIFFVPGYSSNPPATITPKETVKVIVLALSEVGYLTINSSRAVIIIRNELDSNIVVDFDGPSHYTFSIEYKKKREVTIQAGNYELIIAAPGLTYISKDYKYNFRDRFVYRQVWKCEILKTKY